MAKKTRSLISFEYAIKLLLRNKASFDVLEGFLSELLRQDVTVRNITENESNKTTPNDNQTNVDVMVENMKGELIIIELQLAMEFDFSCRMLYDVRKAATEYVKQGNPYMNVWKIYAVHIVYFDRELGNSYLYHGTTTFRDLHNDDVLQLSPQQQQLLLRLETPAGLYPEEYYILNVNNFNKKAENTLDEWISFLKTNEIEDSFMAKGLNKARVMLAYEALTDEEQAEYDAFQRERSHKLSMLASAKD